ncbi:hypothetical protein BJ742DRAFT_901172 [Cladochytrium replicatum]|nr:hypothetical protein BJ742DRAFT_901172 [Cladochytrium replicatum]
MSTSKSKRNGSGNQSEESSDGSQTSANERAMRARAFRMESITALCISNNINELTFVNRPQTIVALEMSMFNYPVITGLDPHFRYLRSVCIVAQDINEIQGLDACTALENLWIAETKITKICNLHNCTELRKLFLYSNRIQKIEGLENLRKLETLWLNDNGIKEITGLGNNTALRELHLGNNNIPFIGPALVENVNLRILNLSGNCLSSFRDVLYLSRLEDLSSLCLSDPNFSENPICALCNYQTHIIYHLSSLKSLDTMDITDESRRIISATVLKKRMYYNMRIRTIKRNANFLIRILSDRYANEEKLLEDKVQKMVAKLKFLQKRLDDAIAASKSRSHQKASNLEREQSDLIIELEEDYGHLLQLTNTNWQNLKELAKHREDMSGQIAEQSDMAIRKLLLELETGGNVRFEEDDKPEDLWIELCESLVKQFMLRTPHPSQTRVQIHRISRIQNRHLRSSFEVAMMPESDRNQQEYLCFSPEDGEQMFKTVEFGFDRIAQKATEDIKGVACGKITLTNFIDSSNHSEDHSNLKNASKSFSAGNGGSKKLRHAIIVRCLTGRMSKLTSAQCEKSQDGISYEYDQKTKYHSAIDLPDTSGAPDAPNGASECELIGRRSMCKVVQPYDGKLVLPEFVLEYSLENDQSKHRPAIETLVNELAFSNKLSQADMPSIVLEVLSTLEENLFVFSEASERLSLTPSLICINSCFKENLSHKTIASLKSINLSGFAGSIQKLSPTYPLTELRTLVITHASLDAKSIDRFHMHFPYLEKLDLSNNSLTTTILDSPHVRRSNIATNTFEWSFKRPLGTFAQLTHLDLRFNPVTKRKGYNRLILELLPRIGRLDAMIVKSSQVFHSTFNCLAPKSFRSSIQPHIFRPLSVRTQAGVGSTAAQREYWRDKDPQDQKLSTPRSVVTAEKITILELDSCNLFNLKDLPTSLINLKWASFRNNNLRDVSHLANFPKLEELTLEHNEIESIDCLTALHNLSKLDVSNNVIEGVPTAASFKSLMHLSLENNSVQSLRPFSKLITLMELYIGNNNVNELYSIFPLKELPRLIILDLTGNNVCKERSYRLFTIFHLSRLKILDGSGILPKEQAQAKEAYFGRLTIELLGEKIGHFTFKNISELDLRNCKLREIDCFSPPQPSATGSTSISSKHGIPEFRNLRKLNLDGNFLTSIEALTFLTGLRCLSLNSNRIERLLNSDSSIGSVSSPAQQLGASTGGLGKIGTGSGSVNLGRISSASVLPKAILPRLEELHLGNNCISKISDLGLNRLPAVKILYLHGNRISKIEGLEQMTSLIELVLDKNQIKSAEPSSFLSLINLKQLHIKDNRIKTLIHFDCLPNLKRLFINNNRIHEIAEIEKMKLPSLTELSMQGNAVARKQLYRYAVIVRFPHICVIDGVEVTEDERIRAEQAYYMDQTNLRVEDQSMGMMSPPPIPVPALPPGSPMVKLPIKIASVVLDGMEMKLSTSFGSNNNKT